MTINSTIRKAGPFIGNGGTTVFPFSFKVFAASDLLVVRLNVSTSIESTLVLNSDYTVTLNLDQDSNPGGNITLIGGALATGFNLIITSDIPDTQQVDLTNQGGFYPEVINDALDKATIQIQQLQEQVDRSIKVPVTNLVTIDELTADLIVVADHVDNIDIVATDIDNVNAVGESIDNVDIVAPHVGNIDIVAPHVDEIGTVAGSIASVNTAAGSIASINTVAADLNEPVSEIQTVADNIGNVNTVGTNIASVNTAAADIANINTVASDLNEPVSEINTVANSIANVDAVGTNIASVNTAAANMAAIIAAPSQATSAANSAASASSSAIAAGTSASIAQTAASASVAGAKVYQSTALGLAATTSGQYFLVYLSPAVYRVYLNSAGTAVDAGLLYIADGNSYRVLGAPNYSHAFSDSFGRIALGIKDDGTVQFQTMEGAELTAPLIYATQILLGTEYDQVVRGSATLSFGIADGLDRVAFGVLKDGTTQAENLVTNSLTAQTLNGVNVATIIAGGGGGGTPNPNFNAEINHVIGYGQSLSVGVNSAPAISTSQPYDSLMFNGGVMAFQSGTRTAFSALVEAGTETPEAGVLQHVKELILEENNISYTQQHYQLFGSVCGQGGTSIAQLSKGGSYYPRILADLSAAVSLAQAAGKLYKVQAFTWTQGESDYVDNTDYNTYKARFVQLCTDIDTDSKAASGQAEKVQAITYQVATHLAYGRSYPVIALAQLDMATTLSYVHMACPMYQFTYSDSVHLNNASSKWLGAYYGLCYKRVIIDQGVWYPVYPTNISRQGNILLVKFHVPVKPLVIDTTQVSAISNYGFELVDSGGSAITISSVSIIEQDVVKIVAATSIPAGAKLRYAFSGTGGVNGSANGPRGNLRDSQGDEIVFDPTGINKRMDNWCVIFEKEC